jgi:3-phenylpropionate/trans-cinnamate dioxygenase ferredoxin subunit
MVSTESDDWLPTVDADQLPDGQAVRVDVAGTTVMVVRGVDDSILAVASRCTHQGAPLDRGAMHLRDSDPTVTCAAHGSVFSLVNGRVRRGPATQPVQAFEARVNDGMVELRPRR